MKINNFKKTNSEGSLFPSLPQRPSLKQTRSADKTAQLSLSDWKLPSHTGQLQDLRESYQSFQEGLNKPPAKWRAKKYSNPPPSTYEIESKTLTQKGLDKPPEKTRTQKHSVPPPTVYLVEETALPFLAVIGKSCSLERRP